jgi:hypothetical protein
VFDMGRLLLLFAVSKHHQDKIDDIPSLQDSVRWKRVDDDVVVPDVFNLGCNIGILHT